MPCPGIEGGAYDILVYCEGYMEKRRNQRPLLWRWNNEYKGRRGLWLLLLVV